MTIPHGRPHPTLSTPTAMLPAGSEISRSTPGREATLRPLVQASSQWLPSFRTYCPPMRRFHHRAISRKQAISQATELLWFTLRSDFFGADKAGLAHASLKEIRRGI